MMTELNAGISIAEQVEHQKSKHFLKQKDFDAYRDGSKYVTDHNEAIVVEMRKDIKRNRQLLKHLECGDQCVIQTVFKDDPRSKLVLQCRTAENTKEEMDQRCLIRMNALNLSKYEKQMKKLRLEELKDQLELAKREADDEACTSETLDSKAPTDYTFTMLENSMDKAAIKKETVLLITRKYQEILSHLKQEHLEMPAKLSKTEMILAKQKRELEEMHQMNQGAVKALEQAKQKAAQVEQSTLASMKQRDAIIGVTRKKIERRTQEFDRVDRRLLQRAVLILDPTSETQSPAQLRRRANQKTIYTLEEGFLCIKEAANVAETAAVVDRVINQKDMHTTLKTKVRQLESLLNRLQEERTKLRNQFSDMKYSGGARLSRGEKLLEDTTGRTERQEGTKQGLEDQLHDKGGCLINIKNGISTLQLKLRNVKLKAPKHNFSTGCIQDQMSHCKQKIDQLLKDLNAECAGDAHIRTANTPYLEMHLEVHLHDDDPIVIRQHLSQSHIIQYFEAQENDVLSAADIKARAKALIDSKMKKQRTRKK